MSATCTTRRMPRGRAWLQTSKFVDRFVGYLDYAQSQLFDLLALHVCFHGGLIHSWTKGNFKTAGHNAHLDDSASASDSPKKLTRTHQVASSPRKRLRAMVAKPQALDSMGRFDQKTSIGVDGFHPHRRFISSSTGSVKTLVSANV